MGFPNTLLNKEHAKSLALLAVRDFGYTFEEWQPPQIADENAQLRGGRYWLIVFTPKVPAPDSDLFIYIDHHTGLPIIAPEPTETSTTRK